MLFRSDGTDGIGIDSIAGTGGIGIDRIAGTDGIGIDRIAGTDGIGIESVGIGIEVLIWVAILLLHSIY